VVMNEFGVTTRANETPSWPRELVELYRTRYVGYVRVAYLLTGRVDVAEELTQEAFIAAAARWSSIKNPEGYVRTAVVNRCHSWFRHRKVERRSVASAPSPCELGADELWDVLLRLPYRRRAAVVLRFYADRSDDDIAAALGCRPATVRTLIHRGLIQMRKEVPR